MTCIVLTLFVEKNTLQQSQIDFWLEKFGGLILNNVSWQNGLVKQNEGDAAASDTYCIIADNRNIQLQGKEFTPRRIRRRWTHKWKLQRSEHICIIFLRHYWSVWHLYFTTRCCCWHVRCDVVNRYLCRASSLNCSRFVTVALTRRNVSLTWWPTSWKTWLTLARQLAVSSRYVAEQFLFCVISWVL